MILFPAFYRKQCHLIARTILSLPRKECFTRLQTPRRHASFMERMSTWVERCESNIHPLILKLAGYLISPKLAHYTDWTAFTYSQRFEFLVRLSKIL